jgi:hypothetical protein
MIKIRHQRSTCSSHCTDRDPDTAKIDTQATQWRYQQQERDSP